MPTCFTDWLLIAIVAASVVAMIAGCAIEIRQRVEWFGPYNARTNAVIKP